MKKLILGFAFLLVAIPCQARIITVDDDGPADFKIIQAAIDQCNDGDTVLIYPGTYYENLIIKGKSITLTSIDTADPNVAAATIIDGNSLGTVVSVIDANVADANAVIAGLTVTNGLAKAGGGIYCEDSSLVMFRCVITGNRTYDCIDDAGTNGGDGAGIYCTSSSLTVLNCVIFSNIAGRGGDNYWCEGVGGKGGDGGNGGGIYCGLSSWLNIANSVVSQNTAGPGGGGGGDDYGDDGGAGGSGGGIYCHSASISNCTIIGNWTGWGGWGGRDYGEGGFDGGAGGDGGGLYSEAPLSLSITNCEIAGNLTGDGGDVSYDSWGGYGGDAGRGGGVFCVSPLSTVKIQDCTISQNCTGSGGWGQGWGGGDGGKGGDGGGIFGSRFEVADCTILANTTGWGGDGGGNSTGDGGHGGAGGGIFCSSSTIMNSTIAGNATSDGGCGGWEWGGDGGNGGDGAGILGPSSTVVNCTIKWNTTGSGGEGGFDWCGGCDDDGGNGGDGAGILGPSSTVINCTIAGNTTGSGGDGDGPCFGDGGNGGDGAGIFGPSSTVVNCTISGNATGDGGCGGWEWGGDGGNGGDGGGIYGPSSEIVNCIVTNNATGKGGDASDQAGQGGNGGNGGDGGGIYGPSSGIFYCDIWANTTGNGGFAANPYEEGFVDGSKGSGVDIYADGITVTRDNICADPLFADPNNGDYHLKSQSGRWDPNSQSWVLDDVTSPCIDAGDPNSDWTAELWPHGKRINMGAYGGTPEASMSLSNIGNVADLNHDEKVDFKDFALLAECWAVKHVLLAEDLDLDGQVDTNDIYVFAENWLWDKQGLVGYWKFDDGNGTVAYDSSGYNNTGVFVSEPVWTLGKFDGGLRFDGIDDAVEIKTDRLDPNAGSISLWAYAEAFSTMPHYLFGHTASHPWNNRIQLYVSDPNGNLALGLGDVHFRHMGIEKLNLNRWYHFVLTWNGKTYEVYVDGVLKATGSYTGLSRLSTFADIGNDGNPVYRDESFCGIIDEVRIYSRTLTPIEVLYLFNE